MKKQSNKKGFTIIEVVLVLAIAGLIFLMVFVALPALQRSQRDTQRRNDMARVDTALTNYQTNNSSSSNKTNLPEVTTASLFNAEVNAPNGTFATGCDSSAACSFVRDYMNSGVSGENSKANTFEDPSGEAYNLVIVPNIVLNSTALAATYSETTTSSNGTSYTAKLTNGVVSSGTEAFQAHVIFVVPGGKCNGEKVEVSSKNDYAVLYRLEGSGVYCIDNQ